MIRTTARSMSDIISGSVLVGVGSGVGVSVGVVVGVGVGVDVGVGVSVGMGVGVAVGVGVGIAATVASIRYLTVASMSGVGVGTGVSVGIEAITVAAMSGVATGAAQARNARVVRSRRRERSDAIQEPPLMAQDSGQLLHLPLVPHETPSRGHVGARCLYQNKPHVCGEFMTLMEP